MEATALSGVQRTNRQVVDMIDAYAQQLESSATMLGSQSTALLPSTFSGDAELANQAVESFTRNTSAVATIFARQNDSFVRIATSLKDDKGERAVGTPLPTTLPVFPLIKSGKTYSGPATLFGQEYMAHYTPLLDATGELRGIAFIGINFTEGLAPCVRIVVPLPDLDSRHRNAGGEEEEEDDVRYPKELKQKVLSRMMAPRNEAVSRFSV